MQLINFTDRDNKKPIGIDPECVVAIMAISSVEKRNDKGVITQKGGVFLFTEIYLDAGGNTIKVPVREKTIDAIKAVNAARSKAGAK